ncbi:hypothetical protein D3C72_1771380 [compost metagenome]
MLLTYPPNVAHVEEFTKAQHLARQEGKGLWNAKDGLKQSPRDFRREKRTGSSSGSQESGMLNAPGASQAGARSSGARTSGARATGGGAEGTVTASSKGAAKSASAVIANAKSRVFHDQSCSSGASISETNRLVLSSAAEAKAKGFTACKRCGG